MKLVFATQPIPQDMTNSIFLAGPSPRAKDVHDWRVEALAILKEIGFTGTVFIPIPEGKFYGKDDDPSWTYINQIGWECEARQVSDKIIFWVARDIAGKMPAFTTNVEFGEDLHSGKMVYGRPDTAEKNRYLDHRYVEDRANGKVFNDLRELLATTVSQLGEGSYREGGEVYVPLFIWQSEQFQSWYANVKKAGNRLDKAELKSFFRLPNGVLFSFSLWVKVWIESEQRYKENESIFSRKDISAVVAFYHEQNETHVVLVKEFRSPVNNPSGYVYELPSGSSAKAKTNPLENAQHELEEETGLHIEDVSRFQWIGTRQLMATLSTHQSQVYGVKLTEPEFKNIVKTAEEKQSFGVAADTECTWVEIVKLSNLSQSYLDWSMLGMIYQAIAQYK